MFLSFNSFASSKIFGSDINAEIKQFIVVSKLNDDPEFRIGYKYDFAFEYRWLNFFWNFKSKW